MLVEAYGDHAISEATFKRWFQRFRNNDFDVRNEERGRQTILVGYDTLSQNQMAAMLNVAQQTISDQKFLPKVWKMGAT